MPDRQGIGYPPRLSASDIALFLDFDGTLVDLAERPDGVVVDTAVVALLERLASRLSGRLALVSGRSIAQLDALLGISIPVAGSHGGEIGHLGTTGVSPPRPEALRIVEAALADKFSDNAGVIIEVKTLGVAIHYRLDPSTGPQIGAMARRLGAEHGLEVQRGKMMVELRTRGHDKGSAIAAMMRMPPFVGHTPVFIGDDLTDEDGFATCAGLGGAGIMVGPERPSEALYRLADVADVRSWLSVL